jgi:molybdopterin-guanine dinucleotide biosynthesis protein A
MVGGKRILDRVAAALHPVSDELLLIANDPAASTWIPGVSVHSDARAGSGGLVGLHAALLYAGAAVVAVAWDMPFLSAGLLQELRRHGELSDAAAVPVGPRGPEPLCAYYPASALEIVNRQLERGELRLSRFLDELPRVVALEPSVIARYGAPDELFFNVNDSSDLATAERLAAARP